MHIFMGFWGPLIFYLQYLGDGKNETLLMTLNNRQLEFNYFLFKLSTIKTTLNIHTKIVGEYDQKIPQSKNCRQTHGTARMNS